MQKPLAMFVAGLIAGAVVVGGVGVVSAVTGTDTPIVACANKKTGAMRYSAKGMCKKSERKLTLQAPTTLTATQIAGPKGDTGATGAKGDSGAAGTQGPTGPAGTGLNTVPVSFGSKTLIQTELTGCCDFGNNNLYIRAVFRNQTGSSLSFGGRSEHQLWVAYFDQDGKEIECGYGCTYSPGEVVAFDVPICRTVEPSNPVTPPSQPVDSTFTYELMVKNVHAEAPSGARYFAIFFRPSPNSGPMSPGPDLPLIDFTATPTQPLVAAGATTDDIPVTMAC